MNLIPILQKYFKKGDKLYSVIHGTVTLYSINVCKESPYSIAVTTTNAGKEFFACDGRYFEDTGECILFPDIDKDWSNFTKIERGDAVVYLKDSVWHLGRATKSKYVEHLGVDMSSGGIYFPRKMVKAELFDFDNFEMM